MPEDNGSERVAAKTYVPAYQRDTWKERAEDLDMSLSEFMRSMIQAGRRGFEERHAGAPTPGGNELETTLQTLIAEEPRSVEEITDHLESQIRSTLEDMRSDDTVDVNLDGEFTLTERQ